MSKHIHSFNPNDPKVAKIADDVLRPVGFNSRFHAWMGFLSIILVACLYAYYIQLKEGLIVTGLRDYVSWGMYIANFVFFVATSLVGMLVTAVLGLIGYEWQKPIARIAELIAVAFAAIAGLVIVMDMGRPERLANVFIHGRVQSPILWDVTVVTTYLVISLLLYLLPLIPDLAISKGRLKNPPQWMFKLYDVFSFNWTHHPEQFNILFKAVRILMILVIPTAFAIHTVTSWLFAVTPRSGWDSTILGPYFLSGAFVAGSAALIIAMFFFRNSYKLKDYIRLSHFDKMGKLLNLTALVYFYFNINEYLVPAYKMKTADAIHLNELFTGHYAALFWTAQILGLIIPMILLLLPKMRKPLPITIIAVFVLLGSWFKRYVIVIPTMAHPYLPQQEVPVEWIVYKPTLIESAVTLGALVLAVMIISVLAKLFPVIPIWEVAEQKEEESK